MLEFLPTLNAMLNSTSAVLLFAGHHFIKKGNRSVHRKLMIGAFTTSTLFLVSYLTYHAFHGTTTFPGEGLARTFYFMILGTHTILAASVPPLAIISLRFGLMGNFAKHSKIARWTYPIWLYVSVTGVIVYVMLYRIQW